MTDKPRLIEVAFPLKQASLASVHEKNVRHGHISTLHIWPARRPLAACRAALLCTLLPDPGDAQKRKELLELIGGKVVKKTITSEDEEGNSVSEEKEVVEGGVLLWGNENAREMDTLRATIKEFYGGLPASGHGKFYVYVIKCADDSNYIGQTDDLKRRFAEHENGEVEWTGPRRPLKIIHWEEFNSREEAVKREHDLKTGWGREWIKREYAAGRTRQAGQAPKVLDPFAGGGAIPLEAMRLGCEVTSADLNPVAWFIQKCTLDYPQRFAGKKWPLPEFVREWADFVEDFIAGKVKKRKGDRKPHFTDAKQIQLLALPDADLAWHVRAWGRWVLERARQELAARYPTVDGEPTVAYLWARTARDPQTTGRIPLLKTLWLGRKRGKRTALLPVPNSDGSGVVFKLLREADLAQPQRVVAENECLQRWEVTAETLEDFLKNGTMNRAGVWSPCSGRPGVIALTMEDLRRQGQQGLLSAQVTAVVVERKKPSGKGTFKAYRLAAAAEEAAARVEVEELEEVYRDIPFGVPSEATPAGGGSGASRAFSLHKYGMTRWRDMFTPRQLFSLGVFVKHIRAAAELLKKSSPVNAEAVVAGLALGFDRLIDFANVNVQWKLDAECINHALVRYALQITWDFGEPNMIGEHSGAFGICLERICEALEELQVGFGKPPTIVRRSAKEPLSERLDVCITDPPYYDAIPYSDLSDLFVIWLKRITVGLAKDYEEVMPRELAPKWDVEKNDGELIDDESRFGGDKQRSKENYESGMARAFQIACEALGDEGRLVIVFANKEVDAWETLVGGLIRGGAVVTASWPIQTEQPSRMRGISSAALSTSVWIVCRKRAATAPAGWEEPVLDRMKSILFDRREELGGKNILQYYFDLGIRGPDFIWAALGPALQAYSEHPYVKRTGVNRREDGKGDPDDESPLLTVKGFLKQVRKLVLQFALGELPGFREIQRDTQGRGETITLDPVTQYYLLHRAYFGLEPAPAGACILYANACGKNETELKVVWNILEQGGKSGPGKKGRPRKENEEGETEEAPEETSGSEYRLLDWSERAEREHLGDSRGGLPSPLIDKVHRMMGLFQRNQGAEVQQLYEEWGLASEPAFPPLLLAIRQLAHEDGRLQEQRLVEAVGSHLKLTRQQVDEVGVLKEGPFFPAIDEATKTKVSYRRTK